MGEEVLNFTLGKLDATLPAQCALDKLTRRALGTPKIRPEMIGNMNLVACGIFLLYVVV